VDASGHRDRARRVEGIGVALGARRGVHSEPPPPNACASATHQHLRKLAEIERCNDKGLARIGALTEREFLVLGLALYAGEGGKTNGAVRFANSDPRMILTFITWLRQFFEIDESHLRMRRYLHADLDLAAAIDFWSGLTGIPPAQFGKPYRAVPDPTIRLNRHVYGCPGVSYGCTLTHRRVMGMIAALLSPSCLPG